MKCPIPLDFNSLTGITQRRTCKNKASLRLWAVKGPHAKRYADTGQGQSLDLDGYLEKWGFLCILQTHGDCLVCPPEAPPPHQSPGRGSTGDELETSRDSLSRKFGGGGAAAVCEDPMRGTCCVNSQGPHGRLGGNHCLNSSYSPSGLCPNGVHASEMFTS